MTFTRKTILALAAVASLGAMFAPANASAFGTRPAFGKGNAANLGHINLGHANFGHGGFHATFRFGSRPVWHKPVLLTHAPVFHAPVNAWHRPVYRPVVVSRPAYPVWRRPIIVERLSTPSYRPIVVGRPSYAAFQAPVRVAGPAYKPVQSAADAVNGENVVMVMIPTGQIAMTGEGQWVEQRNDGKSFQYAEDKRDEWSVYLTDASRGVQLQLDLYQKKVFYADRNSAKRPLYPIVSASAQ